MSQKMIQQELHKDNSGEFYRIFKGRNGETVDRSSESYRRWQKALNGFYIAAAAYGGTWDGNYLDYTKLKKDEVGNYIGRPAERGPYIPSIWVPGMAPRP